MKRILFLAHYFPPTGGAGVQRTIKFVKHLPSFDFLPVVLTGSEPSRSRWAPRDDSLLQEIPRDIPVYRVARKGGDPRSSARERVERFLEEGGRIIESHRPSLIFVTMSPFSDAEIASSLSRRHALPWVADLRDPWALDEFQVHRTRWHRKAAQRQMRRSLASATRIIMNTPAAAEAFRHAFPELARRVCCITNGYDADDFSGPVEPTNQQHFSIVHAGYFHADVGLRQARQHLLYNLLGRVEPGVQLLPRSHVFLLRALSQWRRDEPSMASCVRVRCLGAPSPADLQLVEQSDVSDLFTFAGYLPHEESVRAVRSADLLFLPMHKLPPGRSATIVPGKTYEYMASERPILAAVPEGDARRFVQDAGTGFVCEPDDVNGMTAHLRARFEAWRQKRDAVQPQRSFIAQFERRNLTRILAGEFQGVVP